MEPAERTYGPRECGSCRLWRAILEDARGPLGPCRLGVRMGDFPGTAPACERYLGRDVALPAQPPPSAPSRRPRAVAPVVVRSSAGGGSLAFAMPATAPAAAPPAAPRPVAARPVSTPLPEDLLSMTREEFADLIREALRDEVAHVPLAPKWEGGALVLKPRDPALQPKEIPLDHLFHKVVMIRDRLRVLEQKINGNEKLTDTEKVDLQQYVTKCYGTLTTFNVLFRDERDRFVGEKT
jgi:hypothetical protein